MDAELQKAVWWIGDLGIGKWGVGSIIWWIRELERLIFGVCICVSRP